MDCVAGSRDSTGFCVYAVNYSNTWLAFVSALQLREGDFGLTRITRQAYLGFHGARKPGRFALVARNEGGGEKTLSPRVPPTRVSGLPSCRLGFVYRCTVRAGSDLYQSESILYHLTTARRRRSGDTPALRSLVLQI